MPFDDDKKTGVFPRHHLDRSGWKRVRVGDIGEMFKGRGFSLKDTVPTGIPCTMYGDIYVKYGERFWSADYRLPPTLAVKCPQIQHGDLLFTLSGETAEEIGKCSGYLGIGRVCIGGDILALRPSDNYSPEFLCYAMNSPDCIRQKAQFGQGDAVVHISQTNVSRVEVDVPPIFEQRRIAASLAKLDSHIDTLSALLAKQEAVKKSTLNLLLSGNRGRPKVCLGEIGTFISGTGFPLLLQGKASGDLPFCKVSDFNHPSNANRIVSANNYISTAEARQLGCTIVPKGAIVFAKIGAAIALERKRLVEVPCCIDNNMMAFMPHACQPDFCCEILRTIRFQEHVESTALPSLSASRLATIAFHLPSLSDQRRIVSALASIDGSIASIRAERNKYQALKTSMMQYIFGKITCRDSTRDRCNAQAPH